MFRREKNCRRVLNIHSEPLKIVFVNGLACPMTKTEFMRTSERISEETEELISTVWLNRVKNLEIKVLSARVLEVFLMFFNYLLTAS